MAGRGRRGEQESIPLRTTHLPLHHLLSDPNLLRPENGAVMDRLQVVKGRRRIPGRNPQFYGLMKKMKPHSEPRKKVKVPLCQ